MNSRTNRIELSRIKKLIPRGGIEHITHAGNSRALWARDQIIDWIEHGNYQFFTYVEERVALVLVRREPGWPAYLCTQLDGVWTEDLLALEMADDEPMRSSGGELSRVSAPDAVSGPPAL